MPKKNDFSGLFRGVMLAHLILLLHLFLVAVIGILIIFFKGVAAYLPLILITGLTVMGGSFYYVFRLLRARGKSLRDILNSPMFSEKSIEISLLGGVASLKIDSSRGKPVLPDAESAGHLPLMRDQMTARRMELIELARVLEKDPIDPTVYNRTKRKLSNWKN